MGEAGCDWRLRGWRCVALQKKAGSILCSGVQFWEQPCQWEYRVCGVAFCIKCSCSELISTCHHAHPCATVMRSPVQELQVHLDLALLPHILVFHGALPLCFRLGFYNSAYRRAARRAEETKGKRCFKMAAGPFLLVQACGQAASEGRRLCSRSPASCLPIQRDGGSTCVILCHLGERAGVLSLPQSLALLSGSITLGRGGWWWYWERWALGCPKGAACSRLHVLLWCLCRKRSV